MVSFVLFLYFLWSTILVKLTIDGLGVLRLIIASLSIKRRPVIRLKLVKRVRVRHWSLVVVLVGLIIRLSALLVVARLAVVLQVRVVITSTITLVLLVMLLI